MVGKDWEDGFFMGIAVGSTAEAESISCPVVFSMVTDYTESGVIITKDSSVETWTWVKDVSGLITGMTSDLGRVSSVI